MLSDEMEGKEMRTFIGLVLVVFLFAGCTSKNELVEKEIQAEMEINKLNAQIDELMVALEEAEEELEKEDKKIVEYINKNDELEKENNRLIAENLTLTNEEIIDHEMGTGFVKNHFALRCELLMNLMEKQGINNYFDPSFMEVGEQVGSLRVHSIEGLPWFEGAVHFEGEFIIECKLTFHEIELSPILTLTKDNNDEVMRNISDYLYEIDTHYSVINKDEFTEMVKNIDYDNKILTLKVANLSCVQSQMIPVDFVEVIEVIEVN